MKKCRKALFFFTKKGFNRLCVSKLAVIFMVQYVYDAWGNHAVLDANGNDLTDTSHIGNRNPFRYRGYFYDVETGLYYLQTRYYDPEIGHFLNMDDVSYAKRRIF